MTRLKPKDTGNDSHYQSSSICAGLTYRHEIMYLPQFLAILLVFHSFVCTLLVHCLKKFSMEMSESKTTRADLLGKWREEAGRLVTAVQYNCTRTF